MNTIASLRASSQMVEKCRSSDLRVMIADDHAIVRAGLERIIDTLPGMKVVATGVDGTSTLMVMRKTEVDILLMDFSMPSPSGPELIATIRQCYPSLPVLVISMNDNLSAVSSAMWAGANGFITKDRDPETLMMAIEQVVAGNSWLEPEIMRAVMRKQKDQPDLSMREKEVLCMLAAGYRNQQIAEALFISEKTVSTHKTNLLHKLQLNSTADLIRYADENEINSSRTANLTILSGVVDGC